MGAATFERADWYDVEPASYDLLLAEDTALEASFLEAMLVLHARTRGDGRDVLEPACGSGRLVHALAERGYRVTGFDRAPAMLEHARRRLEEDGLDAQLVEAGLEDFRLGRRFDLAFCLLSTFRYLLDESAALAHLERVAEHLKTGGLYVLGLHLTEYEWDRVQRERWVASRGARRVVCNLQSWPPDRRARRERLRSRLTVEERGRVRRIETSWDFRTYDAAELAALLAKVPALELVRVHDFEYDPTAPAALDGDTLDRVLVLRRRRRAGR